MKKIILAIVIVAFGTTAAQACDGMKGHEKADKGDQSSQPSAKKQDSKAGTKADQKS
jgi:uncharacterized alpha/beta hydrolase family protein